MATLFAAGAMVATAVSGVYAQDKGLIGIAMPTSSSGCAGISDGNELKAALSKPRAIPSTSSMAEDDVPNQLAQIENMVTRVRRPS